FDGLRQSPNRGEIMRLNLRAAWRVSCLLAIVLLSTALGWNWTLASPATQPADAAPAGGQIVGAAGSSAGTDAPPVSTFGAPVQPAPGFKPAVSGTPAPGTQAPATPAPEPAKPEAAPISSFEPPVKAAPQPAPAPQPTAAPTAP